RGTGEAPRYKFRDGVRPLLNNANPIDETLDVLDVLSREIARTLGFEINSFTALLYPRTDLGEQERAAILPFAQIATQTLHRLGGQYAELARRVEADADQQDDWVAPDEPEELPEPSFPELVPLEVIVAELVDAEDEPDVANESGLELITDEFTIATVTVEAEPEQEDSNDGLEQLEFVVATLERRQEEWVIQRQRQTGYRFVESLSAGTDPGFFRGVAKRLGLGGNDPDALDFELEMVAIPGGPFTMGSPPDEPERYDRESPQHEVTVQPFFMGRYPITQAQWRFVAGLEQINCEINPDPSRFKGNDRPVEKVSWYEVVEFCARLSAYTKREYRLPTEAEWEYACRAGTTTPFHFGETISSELASYKGGTTYAEGPKGEDREETTSVDHFEVANAFGLSDMHGNVLEWCQDHWHSNYEGAPTDGSAWLTEDDQAGRVFRGGSWHYVPRYCRSAYRDDDGPGIDLIHVGFRVVCSAPRTL
ncbi:MAG: formylglycine-generating enzyme family protein, partial [Nodosilinea sp.]